MSKEAKTFYEKFHTNENHFLNRVMEDYRYRYLRKEVKKHKGKILVIGCGSKKEMTLVSKDIHTEVWGIDISKTAIDKTRKRFPDYNFEVMDACNMTFKNDSFDIIVCSEVIEHLPDQDGFLDSVHRILKTDGVFVLTTPNWWSSYGLARVIAEKITSKPCTADNQPIDDWAHPLELKKELEHRDFFITKTRGLWYLPPFGKGNIRPPAIITYPIYLAFYPFEKAFSVIFPLIGQMIAITMIKRR